MSPGYGDIICQNPKNGQKHERSHQELRFDTPHGTLYIDIYIYIQWDR